MSFFKTNLTQKAISILMCVLICMVGADFAVDLTSITAQAQGSNQGSLISIFPNQRFAAMSFTATSQNKTQSLQGCATAAVGVSGVALTTVTWQLTASPDGGANYYGLPSLAAAGTITSGVLPYTTQGAITTTAASLYFFNLAGLTNVKITTSGTFTATSVAVQITCSSNKGMI
jgi:hypothetical protein